jgi:hypothetical protein
MGEDQIDEMILCVLESALDEENWEMASKRMYKLLAVDEAFKKLIDPELTASD